jgi:hypothetical protein
MHIFKYECNRMLKYNIRILNLSAKSFKNACLQSTLTCAEVASVISWNWLQWSFTKFLFVSLYLVPLLCFVLLLNPLIFIQKINRTAKGLNLILKNTCSYLGSEPYFLFEISKWRDSALKYCASKTSLMMRDHKIVTYIVTSSFQSYCIP